MSTIPSDWQVQIELTERFQHVYCGLGIHPWYASASSFEQLLMLERLVATNSVIALGEIGLDFSPPYKEDRAVQVDVFSQQLELAHRVGKPVSIHVIKAHNEMVALLSSVNVNGVIHGLGASKEIIKRYIDLGFKIGVNGIIMRENARRYHELVTYFGLEHLVLESDFPHVKIDALNSPKLSDIMLVANKIAALLNMSFEEVLTQTTQNTLEVFNLNGTLDDK